MSGLDRAALRALMDSIGPHEGYRGVFTRRSYPGAWPPGTRVAKTRFEANDSQPVGTLGTVLGSIGHPDLGSGYFVEWDSLPRCAVFVMGTKLGVAS
jgi:hypothetical protein